MIAPAIALIAQRKKLINKFRNAGAVSIDTALDTSAYGIPHSIFFTKLVRDGILVNTSTNFFYLDELTVIELIKQRQKIILMMLSMTLILGLLYLFVSNL
ncbi:MAG: hypothetical protein ABIO04_09425 [Ferruginibacter sp.]